MTARSMRGKHRAARRPMMAAPSAAAGRRAAVVATAGGLLVSTIGGASAAHAAPVDADAAKKLSTVDLGALTDQARQALEAAPVVTVDAEAKVQVERVTPTIVERADIKAAPEPEPEPVREAAPSRSSERESLSSSSSSSSTTTSSSATTAVPDSAVGSTIVSIASRYVGVPYVSGGTTPSGFDCSGFTQYVYAQAGISLPRSSSDQRYAGSVVSRSAAQPGDLIWTPGHISIYAGGNTQIDAPRPGKTIQFRNIWQSNPTFIRVG
ncbi:MULTISPECIES: C40 family peptidase [unclassified Isoptericola]|uniref:C40 family peptidase n=1 Tax=unclassified Isoptericola TaxID=2623355 RepID=UPI00271430D7|nr:MULTISPECIES: C40 family peptidase [unclassified Isoptericola]MDO8143964.1 C40 family peptidase [Isoptericola sp. 178]MDO8149379.1 C40 family peptidase [Isoptericola sp. b515]MDO8152326.1 C40 family peptidase [Isoptericola sp. b408]